MTNKSALWNIPLIELQHSSMQWWSCLVDQDNKLRRHFCDVMLTGKLLSPMFIFKLKIEKLT
jgi:hypothetical protein